MKLLVFDPSGNFQEGNGTTGWAFFESDTLIDFDDIKAKDSPIAEGYWQQHILLIDHVNPDVVVYETYKLQAGKAMEQSWSQLETPQLIGCIRLHCAVKGIKCIGQNPSIKKRFNDDILVHIRIAEKRGNRLYINGMLTNDHIRDAIRHGLYYLRYGNKK